MKQDIVLFVDDEVEILSSIRRAASDENFTALFAKSADEALSVLSKNQVCVLVTDMRMPGKDGLSLLQAAKALYPDTMRIVLSGYAQLDFEQVLSAINHGDIFRYITKPWKMKEDLFAVIWQAIDYYNLRRDKLLLEESCAQKNAAYKNMLHRLEEKISEKKDKLAYLQHFTLKLINEYPLAGASGTGDGVRQIISMLIEDFYKTMPTLHESFTLKEIIWSLDKYVREHTDNIEFKPQVTKPAVRCYGNANLLTMILVTIAKILAQVKRRTFQYVMTAELYPEKEKVRLSAVVELGHVEGVHVPADEDEPVSMKKLEYYALLLAHIGQPANVTVTFTYINQNAAMLSVAAELKAILL